MLAARFSSDCSNEPIYLPPSIGDQLCPLINLCLAFQQAVGRAGELAKD